MHCGPSNIVNGVAVGQSPCFCMFFQKAAQGSIGGDNLYVSDGDQPKSPTGAARNMAFLCGLTSPIA
jgi:hypothetical protein